MSHRHHSHPNRSREQKRAQFAEHRQKKTSMTSILVIVLTALIAVAAYVVMSGVNDKPGSTAVAVTRSGATQSAALAQTANASDSGEIRIPLTDVSGSKAKFFDYETSDNRSVRFFVIKSSDGIYRAALDACDVCYAGRKGYHQEGDDMICNKCGRDFPSVLVNELTGGCNPIGVPRTVDGDKLIIKASELESRKMYF